MPDALVRLGGTLRLCLGVVRTDGLACLLPWLARCQSYYNHLGSPYLRQHLEKGTIDIRSNLCLSRKTPSRPTANAECVCRASPKSFAAPTFVAVSLDHSYQAPVLHTPHV